MLCSVTNGSSCRVISFYCRKQAPLLPSFYSHPNGQLRCLKATYKNSVCLQDQWLPIQRVNFFPWQTTDLQFTVWEIPVFGEEIEGGTSFAVTDSWVTAGRHLWLPRAIPFKRKPALPPAKQLKNCLCHHVYLFANRCAARAAVLSLSRISLDTI